ncbi:hypothetical protein BCIN_05g07730 [Botrytis cinerea B05.10]|uniref:Uncharacterized protein n=1 Tax=Botryotinia fuckeliana (strain B05.10) TaxID=332648 RepID=A0A384JIY0_BOTFB|nr:hypothetical protein BCIN_05g07730 [Botrytis cinerea B05.10]ATZ50422.1 hypothetical protein BCIN_05g07730 [Botrytis cinerea B05.10]
MDTTKTTGSLVETYQKQVLDGITVVNEKLFSLSFSRRKRYLSELLPALNSRIKEVESYVGELSASDRAEDLASMRVVQQDLLRTIRFVQGLLDEYNQQRVLLKFRESSTTTQVPTVPSSTVNFEVLDVRNPFSTGLKPGEPLFLFSKMEDLESETKAEEPVKKSILRQPRDKFPERGVPVHKEEYKVKGMRDDLDQNQD